MQVSAEIRYFWKGVPAAIQGWFLAGQEHPCPAGGGGTRVDHYLRDTSQNELSIKRRGEGAGVEVKGLVSLGSKNLPPPFFGQIEIWAKWSVMSLELRGHQMVSIDKKRWLRKFDTGVTTIPEVPLDASEQPIANGRIPDEGCNVELTELRLVSGEIWWTLALEAFGTVSRLEDNLSASAETLAARCPPAISPQLVASYPAWLNLSAS